LYEIRITSATLDAMVKSFAVCSAYKLATLNFSLFVARKHWLKSCASPLDFSANVVNIEELLQHLRMSMYAHFDQLQTPIAQFLAVCSTVNIQS
jgi:hypothetical protein